MNNIYPAHCRAVMGPWTFWGTRKWNCRQSRKRQFCSKVCCTWAILKSQGRI